MFLFFSFINRLFVLYSKHWEKYIKKYMNFYLKFFRICILLLILYFFKDVISTIILFNLFWNLGTHEFLYYVACINFNIFFSFHYCLYFMEYVWLYNLFWQIFFPFYSSRFKVYEELVLEVFEELNKLNTVLEELVFLKN